MKVIMICNLPIESLPPVVSTITVLDKIGCEIVLITPYLIDEYKTLFSNLRYYQYYNSIDELKTFNKKNVLAKNMEMYFRWNDIIFNAIEKEYTAECFVWILHENTASRLDSRINKYNYAITIYEMKRNPKILKFFPSNVKKITKNANIVITPEYNRSHILATWWNLQNTSFVLPNKPYIEDEKLVEDEEIHEVIEKIAKFKNGKKILLYQGGLGPDRNLEPFIKAVEKKSNYKIVIMGPYNSYVNTILEKNSENCMFINSIVAPKHLLITKCADVGIVSYINSSDSYYDPLNVIYCAPNKIFEYSKYSIPMICSNQPGLHYSVEINHAGICVDINNVDEIRSALDIIENNENFYKEGAKKMYNSVDVLEIISNIINKMGEIN